VSRSSHVSVQCIAVNTLFLLAIFNPSNAKLNPICHLLALLGAHHILHVSRVRVKEDDVNVSLQSADTSHPTNTLFIANGNFIN